MAQNSDANSVVDKITAAYEQPEDQARVKMLDEANTALKSLSQPEQELVAHELVLEGLLPNIAINTGIVGTTRDVNATDLQAIIESEGTASLAGLAAKFTFDNLNEIGGSSWHEANVGKSEMKSFDKTQDEKLAVAHTFNNFDGLLTKLKAENLLNVDIQENTGFTRDDIERMLAKPEGLSRDEMRSLNAMRDHFDVLGNGELITRNSLDIYRNYAFPLGEEFLAFASLYKSDPILEETAQREQNARESAATSATTSEISDPVTTEEVKPELDIPQTTVTTDVDFDQQKLPDQRDCLVDPSYSDPYAYQPFPLPTFDIPSPAPPVTSSETMVPPVETPAPPVETPAPPVETPAPLVEIPAPPVEIPVPPVEIPVPPREIPAPPLDTAVERQVEEKQFSVSAGDNLWRIARKHLSETNGRSATNAEVSSFVDEIVKRNTLKNPNLIRPNQRLVIPITQILKVSVAN